MKKIEVGLVGERNGIVSDALTASQMGSGVVDVYATPALIALMEAAAVAAVDPLLPEGQASVGVALEVKHLAATPVGGQVRAQAEVIAVDGNKVSFRVRAWDERELIGEGYHTRMIIDLERFQQRVVSKMNR